MDARAGVGVAACVALALAGCGGATTERRGSACDGFGRPRVLARGTLAYDAVAAGDAVIAIELDTRFALVVHDAATGAVRARVDLGPAERDLGALAVADDGATAWVGGRDQAVRAVDLRGAGGAAVIATWPVGETVTAIAAGPDHVVIGDAAGVLCLRRRGDGALLQCVTADDGAITALTIAGAVVRVDAGVHVRAFALPSLAEVAAVPPRPAAPPPAVMVRQPVAGTIRHARLGPAGVVVAAWIGGLDDPSVILTPPGCAN